MAKPKPCRSYEFTGDILDDGGEFKKFFRGLAEYLKGKLQRLEVKGADIITINTPVASFTIGVTWNGGNWKIYGNTVRKQNLTHLQPEMQSKSGLV